MADARGATERLRVTPDHRVFSRTLGEFVRAADLRTGDRLDAGSGADVVVRDIRLAGGAQPVFNIEVHRAHCYRVTAFDVLVHNVCGENAAAARGRAMHQAYAAESAQMGLPSAPTTGADRPDRMFHDGSMAELKPDTPSGRKRGWAQAQRYADNAGKPCRIDVYDPSSPTLSYKTIGTANPR